MISPLVRIIGSALLGCLLSLSLAGQSKPSEKAPPGEVRNTAGLVNSAQLTEWMQKNGIPKGTTATINQWEYAMNKLIPGGWQSYHYNFLNPAYEGKKDPTQYTADQFLQGLKKYEAERNQGKTKK